MKPLDFGKLGPTLICNFESKTIFFSNEQRNGRSRKAPFWECTKSTFFKRITAIATINKSSMQHQKTNLWAKFNRIDTN